MTTEVHENTNGSLKKVEAEQLGAIKEEVKKPADLCSVGDANGKVDKSGCESLADKNPLTKKGASKQKRVVINGEDEGEEDEGSEPQDGHDDSSEEEEEDGEGDENVRGEAEPYEEDDEEYVDDGEEDEGDDDESEPPSKRRK